MENLETMITEMDKARIKALDKDQVKRVLKEISKGKELCTKISKVCDGHNFLTVISANVTIIAESLSDLRKEDEAYFNLEWARDFLDSTKSKVLDCLVEEGWK